jgi:AcrR family transcriptional regulator
MTSASSAVPGGSVGKRHARWSPLVGDARETLATMPPTARRILDATIHLLSTEGFAAISLNRIADLSGESKPSIHYYFGSKAGLVATVADALIHDYDAETLIKLDSLPVGARRIRALVRAQEQLARDTHTNQPLLEILPGAARDEALRRRLGEVYDAWRGLHVQAIAGAQDFPVEADVEALGTLSLAISDGLSIQYLVAGDDARLREAARLWERALGWLLEEVSGPPASGE